MSKIRPGMKAPLFCLLDSAEKKVCLKEFMGKNVILYFYPKDNTPGCTLEALDFSRLKEDFRKRNTVILGISTDSCASHQKFIDSKGLTITLLSDPEKLIHNKYGVWRPKIFMGREFLGTVRSTFLVDIHGKVVRVWDPVRVQGHAKDVLDAVKGLKG